MTVQELIDELMKVEDKNMLVLVPDILYNKHNVFTDVYVIDNSDDDIIQLY